MSFSYTVKESLSGFQRAKLSTFVSIVTISISLLLLGIFAVVSINASRVIEALRNKVEIEAFLQEPITRSEVNALRGKVAALDGVDSVVYVSKEEAARIFKEEFGEDIQNVLDFNPLPPSFKVSLKDRYKTADSAQNLYEKLSVLKGIDEVIYRKALLELIDRRTTAAHNITLGLGVLISLSAIMLVSNTIRLAIYAKRRLIRTMELVGATGSFIRLPFLLEGIVQGCIGGILAGAILYVLLEYTTRLLTPDFSNFIHMEPVFYLLVLLGGIVLGLIGAIISVTRFIRRTA